MSVLEFDSIEKAYSTRQVLSSIYMKCETGSIVGLLGRNGSGKSTLMKAVFGTLPTTCRSVRIDKLPLMGNYLKRKLIGYLPQESWVPPYVQVDRALAHFDVSLKEVLDTFPEFEVWRKFPVSKLSGGYRRILEVLLILNSPHKFVLLDEPFSGIMPKHIDGIREGIVYASKRKGIIVSDHLYRHVLDLADKTYLLSNGITYPIKSKDELVRRGYLFE